MADIRTLALPDGETIPVLGIGTWNMADRRTRRMDEIVALQAAVDLGMTVIDTAEMYGNGAAESLVGEAIAARRGKVFLVSKVLPQHASRQGTVGACEASLRRLKTDRLDLYLLHWRGGVPLQHTLEGFDALIQTGKIRYWGVSNFDSDDMQELAQIKTTSAPVAANQILYNLTRRGVERTLLPWCAEHGVPIMAYSPLEQGRLVRHKTLLAIAARHNAAPAQVALAWILRLPGILAIPKAAHIDRVRENFGSLALELSSEDYADLDKAFPQPARHVSLEMI
jgi:diketogulonate reductase-like aldo/keto reductase